MAEKIYAYCYQRSPDLGIETKQPAMFVSNFIVQQFTSSEEHQNYLINDPDPLISERIKISKSTAALAIIVGESGIGKTTSICKFVQELRDDHKPVLYISVKKGSEDIFNLDQFYKDNFGTSNTKKFLKF